MIITAMEGYVKFSVSWAAKILTNSVDIRKQRPWQVKKARRKDGNRIMQQGEFYLSSDEAPQRLDRSARPNALDVHEEAGATSEQALTQNVTASEQYLHIAYDAVGCGVVVWSTVNQVVAANKVA